MKIWNLSAILRWYFTLPFVPWEFVLPGRNVKRKRKDRTKVCPNWSWNGTNRMRCSLIVYCRVASFSRDVVIKSRKKGERALPRATKGTWEEIHISHCLGVKEAPLLTQNVCEKRACWFSPNELFARGIWLKLKNLKSFPPDKIREGLN